MTTQSVFNLAGYVFDWRHRTIAHDGEILFKLTAKEADLLFLFCEKPNEIVERSFVLKKLWGYDDFFNARSMDVFITKLRKYLSGNESLSLENIRGKGFRLNIKS